MGEIINGFPGGCTPKWLVDEDGNVVAPIARPGVKPVTPTAQAPQIAAGYTGYTDNGIVAGEGKIVKEVRYGVALSKYEAENGRYYIEVPDIIISKISAISAVANSEDAEGKAGLTITIKSDSDSLGYSIVTLNLDDTAPVQTEHTIENGILRLEAFGKQYTKINYLILEEN